MEIVRARGLRRLTGLIGWRDWPAGVAMAIERCRSVHTFGMRFALDLVWLDRAGSVVRVDRAVPPWRVRSCRRARSVLELRSGPAEELAAVLAECGFDIRTRRVRASCDRVERQ